MKNQIYKSEIVGLLRVIGREMPELAYAISTSEAFNRSSCQEDIRARLKLISAYIDDVLNHEG